MNNTAYLKAYERDLSNTSPFDINTYLPTTSSIDLTFALSKYLT